MNITNKILTLIFIIFSLATTIYAQDKIITTTGDTIKCKIIDISPKIITYEQELQDNSKTGRLISTDNVREYIRESELVPNFQGNNNKIEIYNHGRTAFYFLDEERLTLKKMIAITEKNSNAYKYLNTAYNYRAASYAFGFLGGFGIGYCIGSYMYALIEANDYDNIINSVAFAAGAILIVCSIDFEYQAKKQIAQGINSYNNSLKNKNNLSLNVCFSPTGIGLKIGF